MVALRIYVGVGFNAKRFAASVLLPYFGGATITESTGLWESPDGQTFIEPGHVITVAVDGFEQAQQAIKFAAAQAYEAGEQSVMVEYRDTVTFHDAAK